MKVFRIFDKVKRIFGTTEEAYRSLAYLSRKKRYDTDKDIGYLSNYEEFFRLLRLRKIKLLELGINTGGSLLLWRDYFEKGIIAGLDLQRVNVADDTGRIHVCQGLQQDRDILDKIGKEIAPNGFDIIIDDASHIAEFTRISFWHLFLHHLKPLGIYAIEDWGTGYWDSWSDGKKYEFTSDSTLNKYAIMENPELNLQRHSPNHSYGMVGFIKELI